MDLITYGIEFGVGIASLALAVPAWQRGGRFRWVGVVLALAGVAAVAHALSRLLGGGYMVPAMVPYYA